MNKKKPEKRGRLKVFKASVRPAIEVDCSNWLSDVPPESRVSGRFVTKSSRRPAVEVDCSEWMTNPPTTLELTLGVDTDVNAPELALGLTIFFGAMNRLEQSLGGTGLSKVAEQQTNGTLTVNLTPDQASGAEARIRQLCDALNQATKPPELTLPAVVKSVSARLT